MPVILDEKKIYLRLRERAISAAEQIGAPSFYSDHARDVGMSAAAFEGSEVIEKCRAGIDELLLHPAHGLAHCEKVAIEAGAVAMMECSRMGISGKQADDLLICAQVAGIFHDIKRNEENHSLAGGIETERILRDFDMDESYKRYITAAIKNHEAFRPRLDSEDAYARVVSDALYDADKFRWGPDNFTVTLWLIVEAGGIPAASLFSNFMSKMEGICRIKDTFRSETGRLYGPEFIDMGMKIGREIYCEMETIIGG